MGGSNDEEDFVICSLVSERAGNGGLLGLRNDGLPGLQVGSVESPHCTAFTISSRGLRLTPTLSSLLDQRMFDGSSTAV